jgi:ABC-2 type transport system permease protein
MTLLPMVRKEWLIWKRNRLLTGLTVLFLTLNLITGWLGRSHQQDMTKAIETASERVRSAWDHQRDKNPHSAAHFGTYVFKPVSALWFFDRGIDRYVGVSLFLEGHRQNDLQFRPIQDETSLGRHIELSPAFFLTYLMPLIVILATVGSISGEREGQTLPFVFSLVDRRRWIRAKWFASAVMAAVLIAMTFGVFTLILASTGGTWADFALILVLTFVYLLYALVFVTLTMLVSAWSRTTSMAFSVSVSLWVVLSFLIPRLIGIWAEHRIPVPTPTEFKAALSRDLLEGVDGHNPFSDTSKQLLEETLAAHGVQTVGELPFNWNGFIMQEGEKHESAVYERHINGLQSLHEAQTDVHRAMMWVSPVGAVRLMSMDATRTGIRETYRFRSEAEQYRVRLVGELNHDLMHHFEYGDWQGTRSGEFFSRNVSFDYPAEPTSSVLRSILRPFLGLGVWLGLLFLTLQVLVDRRSPL